MICRLALTGAQGTGKSTLARAIADRLRLSSIGDIGLHSGLGDRVSDWGHAVGAHATADTVLMFARLHQVRVAAASERVQIFDRSLLDTLAYADVLNCLSRTDMDALSAATRAACAQIDRQIWLRVTVDYPVESARDESSEFRRAVDEAIGRFARAYSLRLVEYAIPPERIDDIAASVCDDVVIHMRRRAEPAAQPNRQ